MGPEELGRQLRRARQHMGFSLRDVHAVTAIPLPCLAALEEGRLDELPSPVFARGYVRSYAEAVRLDGDRLALELWRCLEEAEVAAHSGARPAGARPARRAPGAARPGPPAGRPARTGNGRRPSSLSPLRQPTSPWVPKPGRIRTMLPALERGAIAVLVVVLAVGIWDLERGRPSPKATGPAQVAGVSESRGPEATPPEPTTALSPQQPVGPDPVADNGAQATYITGKDRFTAVVQATDAPCWVLVRATPGGPALFQDTLQPGDTRSFDATGSLWVRVGNLGHTAVLVDGKPLTLPNKPSFPYNLLLQR